MLATIGGILALFAGLTLLLLPLLATELSRPRDSAWGAMVLLLGLVLVTSAERFSGAPMLAVLSGGLLIGRLASEVGQARWRLLSLEEQQRLWSMERWQTSLSQMVAALVRLVSIAGASGAVVADWFREQRQAKTRAKASTKRWVRPEAETSAPQQSGDDLEGGGSEDGGSEDGGSEDGGSEGGGSDSGDADSPGATPRSSLQERGEGREVTSFAEIDALLAATPEAIDEAQSATEEGQPQS